jgi:hypothetical protein
MILMSGTREFACCQPSDTVNGRTFSEMELKSSLVSIVRPVLPMALRRDGGEDVFSLPGVTVWKCI